MELSFFGSEFVALRIATDLVEALCYKLRCFGILLDGPANTLSDNKSVGNNSSVPTSILNKRHNTICYHCMWKSQASEKIRVGWIPCEINLEETTMGGIVRHLIVEVIFHNKAAKYKTGKNDDNRKYWA